MVSLRGYKLSLAADRDLEEIFDYTFKKFGLDQATRYLVELESIFAQVIENQGIGKARDEIKPGLRSFPKASQVVYYRVLKDHIRIVRILHGSRDIPRFSFLER